jgi:hypothetical protein
MTSKEHSRPGNGPPVRLEPPSVEGLTGRERRSADGTKQVKAYKSLRHAAAALRTDTDPVIEDNPANSAMLPIAPLHLEPLLAPKPRVPMSQKIEKECARQALKRARKREKARAERRAGTAADRARPGEVGRVTTPDDKEKVEEQVSMSQSLSAAEQEDELQARITAGYASASRPLKQEVEDNQPALSEAWKGYMGFHPETMKAGPAVTAPLEKWVEFSKTLEVSSASEDEVEAPVLLPTSKSKVLHATSLDDESSLEQWD